MDRWVEWDITFSASANMVLITLTEMTKTSDNRWPKWRQVGADHIDLGFHPFMTYMGLARRINRLQDRLMARYRNSSVARAKIDTICADLSKGRRVIDDAKTSRFIDFFAGRK